MKNVSGASRVIVRSLSKPPRALSIAVYTILPIGYVDLVRAQPLQHGQRVASLEHEFRERRLVEHDDVLAARPLLVEHVRQPLGRVERVRRRTGAVGAGSNSRAPS